MLVSAEIRGKRITLDAPYALRGLKAEIPGAYFSDRNGWTVPLNMETCRLLRRVYGSSLEIGPALWAWAKEMNAHAARMAELAASDAVPLPRVAEVAPELHARLLARPFQTIAARFIADGRTVLIGDTVGLGKTTEAIAGILESGVPGPYLVICPKTSAEAVWARDIRSWAPDASVLTFSESAPQRGQLLDALLELSRRETMGDAGASLARTWVVLHPAMVESKSWWVCRECESRTRVTSKPKALVCGHNKNFTRTVHEARFPQLFEMDRWGAFVVDESDQAIIRLKGTPTMIRHGLERLRDGYGDAMRIAMSGTPWRSRPQLLWSTLNWLRPDLYTSFWNWVKLYWQLGGYTGFEIKDFIAEREEELWRSLDGIMLRRTRQEVMPWLPAREYPGTRLDPTDPDSPVAVWLELTPGQRRAYQQMAKSSAAVVDGGTVQAVGALAELTRLKQMATSAGRIVGGDFKPSEDSNKLEYLIQALVELGFPDAPETKVVVASQFTETLRLFRDVIERRFKIRTAMIAGPVSQADRTREWEAFEDPTRAPHVMFLATKAGGSSITLDAATDTYFLDETYVPDDQEQVEGRTDNRQPERRVVKRRYHYLRSLGTVEEGIARVNAEQQAFSNRMLAGRKGVEYARRVMELAHGGEGAN